MKKPIKYTNERINARVITDFLPPPGKLRLTASALPPEPEIWTKDGKEQFVILPYEQYQSMRRRLEAAENPRKAGRAGGPRSGGIR